MEARQPYDLLVVGGGINGAGIARDAAGRGLRVLLCEQDDLAGHTSSASSKLIHGGLRYLEYYEFGLVSKALAEREVLLRAAPHIIWPLRFVMPHAPGLRPAWMIRLGLALYDHLDLGKRELLPGSRGVRLDRHPAGAPLQGRYQRGFEYSDAWVEDMRLVVLNALDAAERGAEIRPRTRCAGARRDGGLWHAELRSDDAPARAVTARALVNATGPWAARFFDEALGAPSPKRLRLVQGSHIVVPRLFEHDYAYIFQNPDRRVVFALPFAGRFTLVGTTDVEYTGDPARCEATDAEVEYLCESVNRYLARSITPADVVHRFSGVRPLIDDEHADAASVTRDYLLHLDEATPPLLTVFGGKITTFRRLAEEAMDRLAPRLGARRRAWTADAPLPGGDIEGADFERFLAEEVLAPRPWLPRDLARRYARAYGTRIVAVLCGARSMADLGEDLGAGLHEAEVGYLAEREWARTADDVLWRRTRLGLVAPPRTRERLDRWLRTRAPGGSGVARAGHDALAGMARS